MIQNTALTYVNQVQEDHLLKKSLSGLITETKQLHGFRGKREMIAKVLQSRFSVPAYLKALWPFELL